MFNGQKIRKMKTFFHKILLVIPATCLVCFPACDSDFLEEKPLDFLAPDNAYTTVEGITQGINGLHWKVRNDWFFGEELQDVGSIFRGLGSDIAFHGEDPNSTRFLCNYVTYLTSASEYVEEYWTNCYELIQYANVLIAGINQADETIWTSEAEKQACLAEAMFFRAYAYRILASFFGDVPLVTEVTSSARADFVRAPVADIYQQIETDLNYAATYLPEPGEEDETGRITQGAAWHLLADIYLAQSKYQDAVDAATQVIEGYHYNLMRNRFGSTTDVFGTGDVFLDLFAYGNQNLSENTESIWVIQFEPNVTGGDEFPGERAWGPAYFRMGNTPDGKKAFRGELVNGAYTGYSDTLGRGVSWIRPTNYAAYDIWRSDWDNDYRNAPHNIKRNFYFDNPESAYHGQKIDFSLYPASAGRDPIRDTCQYIYPFFMKFADPCHHFTNAATSGGGWTHKDVYAMRLAETYLFRAEAYLGLERQDLAAADINQVRTRSNASPVTADQVDIDYLLDERARELYGEECRHITLRRGNRLVDRVRTYNNNPKNPGLNIQDYNNLWPIPLNQIDLNVGAEMTQNPGY